MKEVYVKMGLYDMTTVLWTTVKSKSLVRTTCYVSKLGSHQMIEGALIILIILFLAFSFAIIMMVRGLRSDVILLTAMLMSLHEEITPCHCDHCMDLAGRAKMLVERVENNDNQSDYLIWDKGM